jgi:hypothetical protein
MLAKRFGLTTAIAVAVACGEGSGDAPVVDAGGRGGGHGDAAIGGGGDAAPGDPGIEPVGGLRRFDLVSPMCTVELFDSGAACPADDPKCLCLPEFAALNPARGSEGNPDGRVIIIAQPRWGKRDDGSYAFDAYAAIKERGNTVGHYVNELNPSASCTLAEAWTPDKGCAGGSGCGWRCVTGTEWADQLVAEQRDTFGDYPAPALMALNEAWSTIYDPSDAGIYYRQFLRDLTARLAERGRLPLLYVQQRTAAAGPYTLLSEIADHALIGVEAYLSGREVLAAPGQCAPPYDGDNWCVQQYAAMRGAIRRSASPPIALDRIVMLEHFATNTYRYTDANGNPATSGWGRAYDDDPDSPSFGTPSTSAWNLVIERRARATKALPSLGGVASYCFACNGSGTGSSYRVEFSQTWSRIELP